jgi:hypothetical protein
LTNVSGSDGCTLTTVTASHATFIGDREDRALSSYGPNTLVNYRAYVIGPDGRFQNVVVLDCVDDSAAIASAKRLVDGHAVELWQLGRRIARFERKAKDGLPFRIRPATYRIRRLLAESLKAESVTAAPHAQPPTVLAFSLLKTTKA